jgi:hypothetical protein
MATTPDDRPPGSGPVGTAAASPSAGTAADTPAPTPAGPVASTLAADGIPLVALRAYWRAAAESVGRYPACGLPWPLLAAIGRIESDHGQFGGSQLHADGTSAPPIRGIALNGVGTALIRDTDGGRLDGDTVYDRAVGPMQFIPSTWAGWGLDGNADHVASPFNIYDAATAAANYLCAAGGDLQTGAGQIRAVLAYNDSAAYLSLVLALEKAYAAGVPGARIPVTGTHPRLPPGPQPALPPVNPGPPLDVGPPVLTTPPAAPSSTAPTRAPTTAPAPPSSTAPPSSSAPASSAPPTTPTTPTTPAPSTPTAPPDSPAGSPSPSPTTSDPASPSDPGSAAPSDTVSPTP